MTDQSNPASDMSIHTSLNPGPNAKPILHSSLSKGTNSERRTHPSRLAELLFIAVMGDAATAPAAVPSVDVAQINGHSLHILLFKDVSNAP
jgi:hypothetical protein